MNDISWSSLIHGLTRLPLLEVFDLIPQAVRQIDHCDLYLWDHQRRTLASMRTGARFDSPDELTDQPHSSGVIVRVSHQGDDLGFLACSMNDVATDDLSLIADLVGAALRANVASTDVINMRRRSAEMSLAAEMQWELLPPMQFSTADAWVSAAVEPAYDTGGDIFDYALNEGRLSLSVLDARGHGLRAATTAAVATSAMRRARRQGDSLVDTAAEIGSAVAALGDEQEFVTAVLAEVDLQSSIVTWLCAGHLAPLIVGERVKTLPLTPALPLGLMVGGRTSEPVEQRFRLEAGQSLVLYSDGIIENVALDIGESLGDERFHHILEDRLPNHRVEDASIPIARTVVEDLLALTGAALRDDATVLIAQSCSERNRPQSARAPDS